MRPRRMSLAGLLAVALLVPTAAQAGPLTATSTFPGSPGDGADLEP